MMMSMPRFTTPVTLPNSPTNSMNAATKGYVDTVATTLIAELAPTADTTTLTFSNIPQTYQHLRLVMSTLGTNATTNTQIRCRPNGVSSATYDFQWMTAAGGTLACGRPLSVTYLEVGQTSPNLSSNAMSLSTCEALFPNYAVTQHHMLMATSGYYTSSTAASLTWWSFTGWNWSVTAPTTSLVLTLADGSNFKVKTVASLYGLN
jgi:hypothetical protein